MKTKHERIRELRDSGMSLQEAKATVERQDLDIEIRDAKTVEDLKSILWSLTARLR
jgi:ribosomal protein L7/L12